MPVSSKGFRGGGEWGCPYSEVTFHHWETEMWSGSWRFQFFTLLLESEDVLFTGSEAPFEIELY